MRLIQLTGPAGRRSIGMVEDDRIRILAGPQSIYALAKVALADGIALARMVTSLLGSGLLNYDEIYQGASEWQILPAVDHPDEPARCMVGGTGLSHIRSAHNRQAMHAADERPTDSMRMYQWGLEGGRPAPGEVGVSPEWFYKGTGTTLRAHNQPLEVPPYSNDGGEEPEIAGVYIVDASGAPRRIGMVAGNEFSDHEFEKKNYLYLAASKLRTCAIGPELVVDPDFDLVPGEVSVDRGERVLWSSEIRTGESAMCHSLSNIEHHHFKFEFHRRPGDLHIHFFGADAFSCGDGVRLEDGDVMQVRFTGFGRPLRNPLSRAPLQATVVAVRSI